MKWSPPEYSREDLHILNDPIGVIQKRPLMYVGKEKPTGGDLATRLMSDLILLDAIPARVVRLPPWWIISSEKDWLNVPGQANVETVFSRIVPFPEAGPNSHRAEILLSAFADAVITSGADGLKWVKGREKFAPPEEHYLMQLSGGRTVAFLCEGSRWPEPRTFMPASGQKSEIVLCLLPLIASGRAGSPIDELAADVIAANLRFNSWCASQKTCDGEKTKISEDEWLAMLDSYDAVTKECQAATKAFFEDGDRERLIEALPRIRNDLNRHFGF